MFRVLGLILTLSVGLILGTIALTSVMAVTSSNVEAAQKSAKQILQDKLKALQAFKAEFKQEVSNKKDEMVSQSRGMIYLQRPNHFMMHTTSPDELALYTKGKNDIYYYDAAVNQVSIYKLDQSNSNPLLLLTSTSNKLWRNYSVSQSDNRFTLMPLESRDVRSITISFLPDEHFDAQGHAYQLLESITMRMEDGNNNFYLFQKPQTQVKSSDFIFNLPDDVEVDDAR